MLNDMIELLTPNRLENPSRLSDREALFLTHLIKSSLS